MFNDGTTKPPYCVLAVFNISGLVVYSAVCVAERAREFHGLLGAALGALQHHQGTSRLPECPLYKGRGSVVGGILALRALHNHQSSGRVSAFFCVI